MKLAQSRWLRRRDAVHYDSCVRFIAMLVLLLFALQESTRAQTRPASKLDPDRLGMTCAQILAMSSTDWVSHFNGEVSKKPGEEKNVAPDGSVRPLTVYGKCYDARTDRLSAVLAKSGKGPLMGARGSFRDFEQALDDFSAKALAVSDPPADQVKKASAALYAKQFRYNFYRGYETRKTRTVPSPEDFDALGLAKNRFGELLSALPEDKMRGVHAAFGQIFEKSTLAEEWRLEIYRYAIFVLEPSSATPFSPPPF